MTDLSGRDLSGRDLSDTNLSNSNLSKADLSRSDFEGSNMNDSNLSEADLEGSILSNTNLAYSNLSGATLKYSNLTEANLTGANLTNADLSDTDMTGANLTNADLTNANLSYSNLSYSNLSGAILTGTILKDTILTGTILEKKEPFPQYINSITSQPVIIDINNNGIDVVSGDGDIAKTKISDFLNENHDDSIVMNVINERSDKTIGSTIYLFNKEIFKDQLKGTIVFPCAEANKVLNSVIKSIPLYNMARLINRRINIHIDEFDDIIKQPGNIFINFVKTPETYPSIASSDVVNGTSESWVGALHCSESEPEEIWSAQIATTVSSGGRKTRKLKTRKLKTRRLKIRRLKTRRRKIRRLKTRRRKF